MRYSRSSIFAATEDRGHPLVIHTRLTEGTNPTLLLLVHGWGGKRYDTWGEFPRFLFEEFRDADVGLFDYVSGLRRLTGRGSTKIEATARELADLIRETDHENVVLLGHSMGGIIAMAAIKELIDSNARDGRHGLTVERIRGLFLLATPQGGSAWARLFAGSRDGKVLRPGSKYTREIQDRFIDRVQMWGPNRDPDLFLIPTRALIASRDRIVTATSARLHLPKQYTFNDRAGHRSVVKPVTPESNGYQWITTNIRGLIWPEHTIKMSLDMIAAVKAHQETGSGDGPRLQESRPVTRPARDDRQMPSWTSSPDPTNTGAYVSARWEYAHEVPSQPATPHPVLYVPFGQRKGDSYSLEQPETTIGRDAGCDIVLTDPTVSNRHAVIIRDDTSYRIRDLASTNGTYVDHAVIAEETALSPGSLVHVGSHRFVFLGASE